MRISVYSTQPNLHLSMPKTENFVLFIVAYSRYYFFVLIVFNLTYYNYITIMHYRDNSHCEALSGVWLFALTVRSTHLYLWQIDFGNQPVTFKDNKVCFYK